MLAQRIEAYTPHDPHVRTPGTYFERELVDRSAGYGVRSDNRTAPAVGVAGRPYVPSVSETPGPLDYGVPKDPGARSKAAFSFRGVDAIDPLKKNPGPGA